MFRCKPNPKSKEYKSKCSELVSKKKGLCCVQKDLVFIRSAVNIYNMRTSDVIDPELESMKRFIDAKEMDTEIVLIDVSSKNGEILTKMISEYRPKDIVVVFSVSDFKLSNIHKDIALKYDTVISLNNVSAFDVIPGRNLIIDGENSRVSLNNHPIFQIPTLKSIGDSRLSSSVSSLLIPGNTSGSTTVNIPISNDSDELEMLFDENEMQEAADIILSFTTRLDESNNVYTYRLDAPGLPNIPIVKNVYSENESWSVTIDASNNEDSLSIKLVVSLKGSEVEDATLETVSMEESDVMKKVSTDLISLEEVSVKEFLEESEKNIVIIEPDGSASLVSSDGIDFESIFFECKEAIDDIIRGPSDENVISSVKLLNGRHFGSWGYYSVAEIKKAAEMKERILSSSLDRRAVSITSRGVFLGTESSVSASHCQSGQDANIMKLKIVKIIN